MLRYVVWQLVQGQSGGKQSASKRRGSMALGGRMDTVPSPSASPTWNRSRPISSTRQSIIRNLATRKRFVKFSNATGSPSTNAMFGIETPMGRTPFQGASLDVASPRAQAPDFAKPTSRLAFWRHLPQHEGRHSVATAAWALLLDRSAVIGKCPNSSPGVKTPG